MAKSQTNRKSLVIVESPAKAKTINKYLGADYQVMASMGHVRDLPSTGLNVDVKNNFEPTYKVIPGRKKMVSGLKAASAKCGKLYLATDLDREGEAIAWHLAQLLGVNEENVFRVIFNAITQSAIKNAFERPGKIDMDKVLAQQARRILDRLVGYQISPLLWKKVVRGLSAGRVQSVAVKIIVERERQIRAFVPEEYWLIPAIFSADLANDYSQQWLEFIGDNKENNKKPASDEQDDWLRSHNAFMAELYKIGDQKFHAPDKAAAERIFQQIKNCRYFVSDLQEKQLLSRPSPPFITSTPSSSDFKKNWVSNSALAFSQFAGF